MKFLAKIIVYAIAVIVGAYILPGVSVDQPLTVLVVAVVLILLRTFLKPILTILTLPINILTLGLFTFVINVAIIALADLLVNGFRIENLLWALVFSILLSLIIGAFDLFDKVPTPKLGGKTKK